MKELYSESESCSVVSDSLRPLGLYSPRNSPGQNPGVGRLSLLQEIFLTQGSNPGLPHCQRISYQLSHKGSPRILEWVAYLFSRGSSWPGNQPRVSCIAGRFFTNWTMREAKRPICVCINTDTTRSKSILSYELHIFIFLCLAKSTNIHLLLKKNYLLLVWWEVEKSMCLVKIETLGRKGLEMKDSHWDKDAKRDSLVDRGETFRYRRGRRERKSYEQLLEKQFQRKGRGSQLVWKVCVSVCVCVCVCVQGYSAFYEFMCFNNI